jgi:hypothetical protein
MAYLIQVQLESLAAQEWVIRLIQGQQNAIEFVGQMLVGLA